MSAPVPFPFENPAQQKFLAIDEEGYFSINGVRADDVAFGSQLLSNLVKDERHRYFAHSDGTWALLEPFDEVLVAKNVERTQQGPWNLLLPYGVKKPFLLESLSVDEWDRFHGQTLDGMSFVMSRAAQSEFFRVVDDYDDDAVIVDGQRYHLEPWLTDNPNAMGEYFWTNIFKTEPQPPFDLGEPAIALRETLPQLKLNKMRIAVLGAGKAHDAAFLAQQGHLVTAIDISPEAIQFAKAQYGAVPNLTFLEADIFNLPVSLNGSFDLIFEHTCYCAIPPSRRNELVQVWRQLLADDGHVLGVFFAMDKRFGPPFGGSEWELRQRFKNHFDFVYWTRWRRSLPRRLGHEIVIYMKKKGVTKVTPQIR